MLRIFKYLKPYFPMVILVLLATFANAIGELLLPNLMSSIIDIGVTNGDTAYIISVGIKMLIVAFLSMLAMIVSSYFSSRVAMSFSRDLRRGVFLKVQSFTPQQTEKFGTASLLTRNTDDINQVQRVAIMGLRMLIRSPIMFIGGIMMAYRMNQKLSMILLVSMPIIAISIIVIGGKGFPLFKQIQKKTDKINLIFRERLTGLRIIRAFDKEDYEEERFNVANQDYVDTAIRVNTLIVTLLPLVSIVMNLTLVGVVYFAAKLINMDMMKVGELTAFIQYISQILFSLVMFSMMFVIVPSASASASRINEVLDEPVIKHKNELDTPKVANVHLEFNDVCFRYPGAENPAITGLSFTASAGDRVSIIGGTGSGKSTILKLIEGFYDVESGSIKYNGINIEDLDEEVFRDEIGFAPQRAFLFSGTIAENIRFGRDYITDEDVLEALKIAQGYDFVMSLDDGLKSHVAQGGNNFSGGQKQRLAIARAVAIKPKIYMFDDSFSALDYKTDRALRTALSDVTKDAITLIVAQRVATVVDSDKIIVLDEGHVAGIGTHEELMKSCDVYLDIVESQGYEKEVIA
ncbi:MAG: ABC transporter ATP-binding protein [Tissierellia bacterium]|nr:ABC transporter ATP-binding protein [Tissierellia bacterium]